MKTLFINDDPLDGLGGAALTHKAFIEACPHEWSFCQTKDVCAKSFDGIDLVVLGNFFTFSQQNIEAFLSCAKGKKIVKIEYDFGYIAQRSPVFRDGKTSEYWTYGDSYALKVLYDNLKHFRTKFIYMSEAQKLIHKGELGHKEEDLSVVTSCFTSKQLKILSELSRVRDESNHKWVVVNGKDDWQRHCKGFTESRDHCEANNLRYEILDFEADYNVFLNKLSRYEGIVFLSKNLDTAPRLIIEARWLGLKTVINKNTMFWNENWWKCSDWVMKKHIKEQPQKLWEIILNAN